MKKYFLTLITLLISTFIFNMNVLANNGLTTTFWMEASKSQINVGKSVSISIKVKGHEKQVASTDIHLNYDASKFKYDSYSVPKNVASGDADINSNTLGTLIYSYLDMSGGKNPISSDTIVTFTFTSLSTTNDATGTFTYEVSGVADEVAETYTINGQTGSTDVKIHIPSVNNNLSSLSLSNGTFSPSFDKNTTKYTATVDAPNVTINASAEDGSARINGTGNKNLKYGENNFTVLVTSESGSEKAYVVTITRPDHRNADATLASLSVTNIDFKFDKNTYAYSYTVPNNITSVTVNGKANNEKSTVTGLGIKNLKVGKNNIVVKVTAENESSKSYVIAITREKGENDVVLEENSAAALSNISIPGYSLDFNKNVTDYDITVPNTQKEVTINYVPEDKNAEVSIIGATAQKVNNSYTINLTDGNNSISLIVTASDGTQQTYNITINKETEEIINKIEQSETIDTEQDKNNKFGWLFPVLIVIILGLSFAIAAVIVLRKYKEQKERM